MSGEFKLTKLIIAFPHDTSSFTPVKNRTPTTKTADSMFYFNEAWQLKSRPGRPKINNCH